MCIEETYTEFDRSLGACSKLYIYIYIYIYIQCVPRLLDITARGDFLGLCDQKSSYKHVSDFERLRSYGHFLISVHALV